MNAGVPMATPAPVSVAPEPPESALAMPKSVTMTRPRDALEQDVVGLDVAVDDGEPVGGAERVGRLRHDPAGLLDRQLAPPADPARHRLAVHVPHDEVDQAVALADGVDRHDVGMGQLGGGLRLAGEPLADVLLEGELGGQDLDGDPALEPLVAGAVDDAHAAPPDLALDGVGVTQRRGEPGRQRLVGGGGHGREGPETEGAGLRSAMRPAKEQPDMADNLYSR